MKFVCTHCKKEFEGTARFEDGAYTTFCDECTTTIRFKFEDENSIKDVEFGDGYATISGPRNIDVSRLGYFDELEYECWELILKYASWFGLDVKGIDDEDDVDFYSAKQVQDTILKLFIESGIRFKYEDGRASVGYTASIYAAFEDKYLKNEKGGKFELGDKEERLLFFDESEAESVLEMLNDTSDICFALIVESEGE